MSKGEKMKTINLGRVAVPLDQYASQGNAILGIRGSGKSYTGTFLAERLLDAGVPIVAFDPIGIWRYLRVPAKEGGTGYKVVVAGGEHADIPLPAHGAAEIMRAAMRDGVSIVFDLYDVGMSKADWRRIVESVGKVLLYENKAHGLRHVFIEEAAEFVPQRVTDQGGVYSVVERLVRMGGNAQLGVTLINQRAEEVNKAVLELCDLLILHRQKGKNSLASLSKWMDVASVSNRVDVGAVIPILKAGECFVWPEGAESPTRTTIPEKRTFHPDRRQMQKAAAVEAKSADVSAFLATMRENLAHLAKEAEQNDPKLLRAEIAKLKRELEKKPSTESDRFALDKVWADGHDRGKATSIEAVRDHVAKLIELVRKEGDRIVGFLSAGKDAPARAPTSEKALFPKVIMPMVRKAIAADSSIPAGERAVLTAIAQNAGGVTREQLTVLTGYKRSSRDTYLQRLGARGFIVIDSSITATDAGVDALGPAFEPLPTGEALRAHWMERLPEGERRVLTVIVEAYPNHVDRERISERTEYKRSSRDTYLQRLSARQLITSERGQVRASDVLFN